MSRITRRGSVESAAYTAVLRGWHIFPCKPGSKQPATANGLYDAMPTAQEWWPGHNVGIACGASGLLVVDCDVKHDLDGVAAFEKLAGQPETYTVATPSGGRHIYFRDPDGTFGNSTGSLPAGIDIRGRGGYVVAAGSIVNGQRYRVIKDAPVVELPNYLAKILSSRSPRRGNRGEQGNRSRERWEAWETIPRATALKKLNGAANRVAVARNGERNELLHWAACRFGEAVGAGWIDEYRAEEHLLGAADVCGLVADDGEHAVLATIGSGIRKGLGS